MRGVVDRLADGGPRAHEAKEDDRRGQPGEEREERPQQCAGRGESDATHAVGEPGDRYLQCKCCGQHERDQRQESLEAELELVTDLGGEYGERGTVQLVD